MTWKIEKEKNHVIIYMNSNPMNLMNDAFFKDLEDSFDIIESEYADKTVILTGNERLFSAGLDFKFCHQMFLKKNLEQIQKWFDRFSQSIFKVFCFSQPLVAAINGHCIAGGLILALCAEFRIASQNKSQFALNEIQIGIPMPNTFIETIQYALGSAITQESILSAKTYGLEEALQMGIVQEVVPQEELIHKAIERTKHISPERMAAYRLTKKNLRFATTQNIQKFAIKNDEQMAASLCSPESLKIQKVALERLSGK